MRPILFIGNTPDMSSVAECYKAANTASAVITMSADKDAAPEIMQVVKLRADMPIKKGETLGGPCNRTACQAPGATWWNKSTLAYYCKKCARRIMSYPENAGLLEEVK